MLRSDPTPTHRQRKCLHEHWKNCHDYPEAHTWETRDQEDIEEEEAVRALVAAEDDSYLAYDEACKIRQLTPSASVKGVFATDYKTKVIGKYEDAAQMPSMMGQLTPTTSMSLQTRSGREEKMISRTPQRSACVEEAELFENWWAEIAADLKMEETFSKEDLSNLRRSLELWQSAVEATIREKVIREVVHKLSPDHSQQPSPFKEDEEEHTDEPDEPWITETSDEAEEYEEESEEMSEETCNVPGHSKPRHYQKQDSAFAHVQLARNKTEEYLEEKPSTSGPPPGYDEDWCGPWEGGNNALEEETPDEAQEYVDNFSKIPAEVIEYPKKPRDAPAWYDEDWCGPWEGGSTFNDTEVPAEAKEYPELPNTEEWNTRWWEEPTNEPSPWQQQVDAAHQRRKRPSKKKRPIENSKQRSLCGLTGMFPLRYRKDIFARDAPTETNRAVVRAQKNPRHFRGVDKSRRGKPRRKPTSDMAENQEGAKGQEKSAARPYSALNAQDESKSSRGEIPLYWFVTHLLDCQAVKLAGLRSKEPRTSCVGTRLKRG
ncbi:hypothetical protein EI94DRAFT_1809839 [Lactarius quietus]|nr:hypothetical protein EI94DRAFT_1809839 [Lactarius quietus]